jgi:hypothetical protein
MQFYNQLIDKCLQEITTRRCVLAKRRFRAGKQPIAQNMLARMLISGRMSPAAAT